MLALESHINPADPTFRANRERMEQLVADLRERQSAVAADLHVHAQTVRYRMSQIRELYGDRLTQPESVLQLVIALAVTLDWVDSPG